MTSCCSSFSLRFFEDLKDMLGFTPYRFYYYMWKYITPILLLLLLCTSFIQLTMTPPSYSAWIQEEVSPGSARPPTPPPTWDQPSRGLEPSSQTSPKKPGTS